MPKMARKKRGNPNPRLPVTRGIPVSESLWIPKHYGSEIREKGGLDRSVIWEVGDVVDFIFPEKYQPTYFRVATDFLTLLLEKDILTKKEISQFLKETGYSRSTLENRIIPKLVRFGLIKRERELEGRLKKTEEAELIQKTMEMIDHKFKGIEIASIDPQETSIIRKLVFNAILGNRTGMTLIGPATIVKSIKKDPNKIQLFTKGSNTKRTNKKKKK